MITISEILQGTTPSLVITIPTDAFLVSDVTKLEFLIEYNTTQLFKGLSDVTVDTSENSFAYKFTENETLAMTPGKQVRYQLRFMFADGNIVGTSIMTLDVADLISQEVISV